MTNTQAAQGRTPDKILAWDVTHDGEPRHAMIRMHVGTAAGTFVMVWTIEEAAQLLAQLPDVLGETINAAKRQRSGIVLAPAGTFDDPLIRTHPQNGHPR